MTWQHWRSTQLLKESPAASLVSGSAQLRAHQVHLGEALLTVAVTEKTSQRHLLSFQIGAAETATVLALLVTAWPRLHQQSTWAMSATTHCQAPLHFQLLQLLQALKQGGSALLALLLLLLHWHTHPSLYLQLLV